MGKVNSMAKGLLEKIVRETWPAGQYGIEVSPTRAYAAAREALDLLKRGMIEEPGHLVTFDTACYEAAANYGAWLYLKGRSPEEQSNEEMERAAGWGVGQMTFALGEHFGEFAPPNTLFAPTAFNIRPSTAGAVGFRPYKGELQEAYDAVVRLA